MAVNAQTYFAANPDVASSYAQNSYGMTPDAFAEFHFKNFGAAESRGGSGVTALQILDYLKATPGLTDAQIVSSMKTYGISPAQMAQAVGLPLSEIQKRYDAVTKVTDYEGNTYDRDTILKLAKQITPSLDPNAIKGGVFSTTGESIGFNYDEATKLLGKAPTASEQVILDMARHLAKEGITDFSQVNATETNRRFGSTYTGGGGTIYEIKKDSNGNPVISTWSKDTSDKKTILGGLALAGLAFGIPGLTEGLLSSAPAGATLGTVGAEAAVGSSLGTGLTAGASGLGLNAAGTAGLGSLGTGAGITAGSGLTGTGVLTGSNLGTALLGTGTGVAGLTGTGILSGSNLGTNLLGTTGTGALTGTGVLSGSGLGTSLLGTGTGTAATVGGLGNTVANLGTGALTTGLEGLSTGLTGLGTGLGTGLNAGLSNLGTGLTNSALSNLISTGLTTGAGLLQQQTSREAAIAAQAKVDAETAAAKQAAAFRPIGMTTRFGSSQFQLDPVTGRLTSAGYTLSPEAKAQQDRFVALSNAGLTQAEAAQQQFAPLQTGAQNLFTLGQSYLAKTPEAVAQNYLNQQMALLQPGRELELANLQNKLFQQGRSGVAVAQGGTYGATTPELQALYNARAMQEAQLAAQAQQAGQQQVAFGAGLLGTGAQTMGQYYAGQQAAYAPYTTALGQVQGLEQLGQQPFTMGTQLGQTAAQAGANVGQLGLRGAEQSVALATGQAATNNPYASLLGGLGASPAFGTAAGSALTSLFG